MAYKPNFKRLRAKLAGGGVHIEQALVTGAGAAADIAIAGLAADAQILGCVDLTDLLDELANITVVKAGAIRLSTDTTAKKLLVLYAQHAA